MDYTKNELALLDLINDINKAFYFIGEPDEPAVCDGDIESVSYTHLTLPTNREV